MIYKAIVTAGILSTTLLISSAALADGACDFGERNPEASVGLEQFAFMVGNHRVEYRIWQGDAFSEGFLEAEWNGRWGLDGTMIIDEWYGPQLTPDQPPLHGVNVRSYLEERNQWNVAWQGSTGSSIALEAEMRDDGNMHIWRTYPAPTQENFYYFEVYDDTHWALIEGVVQEDGTRVFQFRRDVYDVPCEG